MNAHFNTPEETALKALTNSLPYELSKARSWRIRPSFLLGRKALHDHAFNEGLSGSQGLLEVNFSLKFKLRSALLQISEMKSMLARHEMGIPDQSPLQKAIEKQKSRILILQNKLDQPKGDQNRIYARVQEAYIALNTMESLQEPLIPNGKLVSLDDRISEMELLMKEASPAVRERLQAIVTFLQSLQNNF